MAYLLEADFRRDEFTVTWKVRMAGSGTGKCLGWLYPAMLLLWAAQTSTLLIVLHFRHWGASTAPPGWFFGFTSGLPQFWSATMKTSPILPRMSNYSIQVFRRELLWAATSAREAVRHSEMVYLLGKYHSRAHNPWCIEIFKIDYLLTSNVQFGSVSINLRGPSRRGQKQNKMAYEIAWSLQFYQDYAKIIPRLHQDYTYLFSNWKFTVIFSIYSNY